MPTGRVATLTQKTMQATQKLTATEVSGYMLRLHRELSTTGSSLFLGVIRMNANLKVMQERCQKLEKMASQELSDAFEELKNARAFIESCAAKRFLQINENYHKIGLVSKVFAEAKILDFEYYNENIQPSAIRETTYEDVTSKHFIKWFFADEDWLGAGVGPEDFDFNIISHCKEKYVYGYFNGDNIDGIMRVDEYDDNYMLSFFITNDSLQNQGIGQSLLQSILQKFTDKKITLRVYTDKDKAIYIYKKYGFEIVDTGYGSGPHPSSPHYVMQRDAQ